MWRNVIFGVSIAVAAVAVAGAVCTVRIHREAVKAGCDAVPHATKRSMGAVGGLASLIGKLF